MWIYWLIIFVAVIYYPISELYSSKKNQNMPKSDTDNRKNISYFVIMSVLMIVIIGLREKHIGNDTIGYYNTYKELATKNFVYLLDPILEETGREKGFVFIQILFNKLHMPFELYNIIYAAFNIIAISLFIYKKSKIAWLSYFLYIAYGMFVLDLSMMRQTTAMSIVILAILYDKNETILDFMKFAIIVYMASLIHSSAIICIPVWFVFKIPYNKNTLIVALCIIAFCYISKSFMVRFVSQIAANVADKYSTANMQEGNAGMKLYLMIIVTVLLGSYKKNFLQDNFNVKMHYLLMLMLMVFPALQGGGAIMRVYYYFYVFMIVYIPNMLYSIKKDKSLYMLSILLYIAVGLNMYISSITGNSYHMVPYKFFWQ